MSKKQIKNTQGKPRIIGISKIAEHLEYIRFTATPRVFREKEWGYITDGDFAKKFKLNPCTLTEWRKSPDFWDQVKNRLRELFKDKIPDVMAGVYKKIVKDGSAAEAKFFMQWVDDWKEKSETNIHYAALKDLQDANRRIFEEAKKEDDRREEAEKTKK